MKEIVERDEEARLQLSSQEDESILLFFLIKGLNKDLIDHFSPNVETFEPDHFPEDLSLDTLVSNFLKPEYSGVFVHYALSMAPVDLETVKYRQETMDELLQDRKKARYLNEVCGQLNSIVNLIKRRQKIKNELKFFSPQYIHKDLLKVDVGILQQYVECIKAFAEVLEGSTSRGLSSIYEYSRKLMENDQLRFLSEQVDNFLNANYIELGVTINAVKQVRRVKFLDTELKKLKRSTLRKIIARLHQPKWGRLLNPRLLRWVMSYDKLVATAFDDLVEDSAEQILSTSKQPPIRDGWHSALRLQSLTKSFVPSFFLHTSVSLCS